MAKSIRNLPSAILGFGICIAAHSSLAQTPSDPPDAKPAPATPAPPSKDKSAADDKLAWTEAGATAQCKDGSYYHGRPGGAACVDHGGVRKWLHERAQE